MKADILADLVEELRVRPHLAKSFMNTIGEVRCSSDRARKEIDNVASRVRFHVGTETPENGFCLVAFAFGG